MDILFEIGEPFVYRTHERECTLFRVAQPLKKQGQKEEKSARNGDQYPKTCGIYKGIYSRIGSS